MMQIDSPGQASQDTASQTNPWVSQLDYYFLRFNIEKEIYAGTPRV